jgi:hypothetical protein
MTDGECTYMPTLIGQVIGDDLMHIDGNTIVLTPWAGENTVQTAAGQPLSAQIFPCSL